MLRWLLYLIAFWWLSRALRRIWQNRLGSTDRRAGGQADAVGQERPGGRFNDQPRQDISDADYEEIT